MTLKQQSQKNQAKSFLFNYLVTEQELYDRRQTFICYAFVANAD